VPYLIAAMCLCVSQVRTFHKIADGRTFTIFVKVLHAACEISVSSVECESH